MDELDALRIASESRAILAKAGRDDLADAAWNAMCPHGVPIQARCDALVMAGYPFRALRAGRPAHEGITAR